MDLKAMMMGMQEKGRKRSDKPLCILTQEEQDRHMRVVEIRKKRDQLMKEILELESRRDSEAERWWADMKDKYKIHGKNLTYEDKTGEIFELIDIEDELK
jgi:hypothetical protein